MLTKGPPAITGVGSFGRCRGRISGWNLSALPTASTDAARPPPIPGNNHRFEANTMKPTLDGGAKFVVRNTAAARLSPDLSWRQHSTRSASKHCNPVAADGTSR